ncbi:hypothetical protein ACFYQ5_23280 [Streptomyces sp. NPDC005794]|uniref:hypothetical protein n=1 Tax=Streptomyces sp. NPDC005794 TaxID=3364733 RepID=UPI0036BC21AB
MQTPVENWREGTRTGHTHEPNDVTVPLDGLGRQLSELAVEPGPPDPSDGPVFVDESGRRSKTYRRAGWALATICAVYAVTLVVSVLGGNSSAPWLPLSGPEEKHAEEVEVRPAPSGDVVAESPAAVASASAPAPGAVLLSPSDSASASGPAGPGASVSASASSRPPRDIPSSDPAPDAPVPDEPAVEPSESATPEPPVEESPPASPDPSESPVQPQEGAQ